LTLEYPQMSDPQMSGPQKLNSHVLT